MQPVRLHLDRQLGRMGRRGELGNALQLRAECELGRPVRVFYRSLEGRAYTLYAAPDLAGGAAGSTLWPPVPGRIAVPGTGGLDSLTDTNALPRTLYRLGIDLP